MRKWASAHDRAHHPRMQATMIVILCAQIITNVVNGEKLINVINPACLIVVLISLLWIEFRCFQFLRGMPTPLPQI
jgi:Na+-translocating ferredoxin:NAD+ oxidoreductase RnfD subunit